MNFVYVILSSNCFDNYHLFVIIIILINTVMGSHPWCHLYVRFNLVITYLNFVLI